MAAARLFGTALMGVMLMQKVSALSWWDMSALEVREKINQCIMAIEAPTPQVGSIENRVISWRGRTTPVRLYIPEGSHEKLPIILFIHGGAWVAGNLDTHDNAARYLCSKVQALVISVGYLNTPEGKFPLPLEQGYDALTWIVQHAEAFNADPSKLALLGDSSGGNMAAALALMARDRNGPSIICQLLINPAPDLSCAGTFQRQNDQLDIMRWQALHYLSDSHTANHPYVSPLLAEDLSRLPEAIILLAEYDDLRESGQEYADRLEAAGVPTYVYVQPGVNHLAGYWARAAPLAAYSLDIAVTALKKVFSISQSGSK